MSSLRLKRFFLSEKDRELYEKNLINEMPELIEGVFYMDDEELENLQKQIKINQMEVELQKNPFEHRRDPVELNK